MSIYRRSACNKLIPVQQTQTQEKQLAEMEKELMDASETIERLSKEVDQAEKKADPAIVTPTLQVEKRKLVQQAELLNADLNSERERRTQVLCV